MFRRILLVEDNGDLSFSLKERFEQLKVDVKCADNNISALGLWKKYKGEFDCIILDLNIYPYDDINLTNEYYPTNSLIFIKDLGWNNNLETNVKVIIYSGYINELKYICAQTGFSINGMKIFEKTSCSINELIDYVQNEILK